MGNYWIGLLTLPAIAAIGAALWFIGSFLILSGWTWWTQATVFTHEQRATRIKHAASVAVARRVWGLKLPAGLLLIYRTKVGGMGKGWIDTDRDYVRAKRALFEEFMPDE